MLRPITLGLALFMTAGAVGGAQTLAPQLGSDPRTVVGTTGGLRLPQKLSSTAAEQTASLKVHRGLTGKPCLGVSGSAQPQAVNPSIFYHMIAVTNTCSQPIKLQVCYYASTSCRPMDVPGYGRREAILGIMPAMRDFRYEYREQF